MFILVCTKKKKEQLGQSTRKSLLAANFSTHQQEMRYSKRVCLARTALNLKQLFIEKETSKVSSHIIVVIDTSSRSRLNY